MHCSLCIHAVNFKKRVVCTAFNGDNLCTPRFLLLTRCNINFWNWIFTPLYTKGMGCLCDLHSNKKNRIIIVARKQMLKGMLLKMKAQWISVLWVGFSISRKSLSSQEEENESFSTSHDTPHHISFLSIETKTALLTYCFLWTSDLWRFQSFWCVWSRILLCNCFVI